MLKLRILAVIAVTLSPVAICQEFDALILDCRVQLPIGFEVETRTGMGSRVSFRYADMELPTRTTVSVSNEGEWQSDNPLDRSPHEILFERRIGRLKHLTVRPLKLGADAVDYEIITDGSSMVRIYGDNRENIIAQFEKCPEV